MDEEGTWRKDELPKIYNDRASQKKASLQAEGYQCVLYNTIRNYNNLGKKYKDY